MQSVCVQFDSPALERRKPETWMCWGSKWADAALTEDSLNHAHGTQLFKSLSERDTQIRSHLEQNCARSNHVAVKETDDKKTPQKNMLI